ncbi:hypothetical protein D9M68_850140 [compost metagenome]
MRSGAGQRSKRATLGLSLQRKVHFMGATGVAKARVTTCTPRSGNAFSPRVKPRPKLVRREWKRCPFQRAVIVTTSLCPSTSCDSAVSVNPCTHPKWVRSMLFSTIESK